MILPHDKHYLLECIKRLEQVVESIPEKKSCDTCKHFDLQLRTCALADFQTPPEDVQRTGCLGWDFDLVPF